MLASTKPVWLQANRIQDKQKWYHLAGHLHTSIQNVSLPSPIHGTSSNYSSPTDHISRWWLVEHSPSILCATTFRNTCQPTFPHKDIRLTITLIDPLVNTSALFKHTYGGTCIQHPIKVIEIGSTPCCICWNSSSSFCPQFTCPNIMAVQVVTFWDGILLNTLQASSMLPHFA
jgi:hypothetical protein